MVSVSIPVCSHCCVLATSVQQLWSTLSCLFSVALSNGELGGCGSDWFKQTQIFYFITTKLIGGPKIVIKTQICFIWILVLILLKKPKNWYRLVKFNPCCQVVWLVLWWERYVYGTLAHFAFLTSFVITALVKRKTPQLVIKSGPAQTKFSCLCEKGQFHNSSIYCMLFSNAQNILFCCSSMYFAAI